MKPSINHITVLSALVLGLGLGTACSGQRTTPSASVTEAAAPEAAAMDSASSVVESAPEDTATATTTNAEPAGVFAEEGVAIGGADAVAYFTQDAYVPGEATFTHEWAGVTWQFASAEHRDLFADNPSQYAPQYGGFCAWAVSQGYTAPIDPDAWKIVDGKLYLNYDQKVQQRWAKDIPGNIAKADQNWPQVLTP